MTFSSTLRGFSPYVKLAPGDAGPGLQGPSPRLTLTSLPGKDFITQGWLYSPCSLRTHATVFFWGKFCPGAKVSECEWEPGPGSHLYRHATQAPH